MKRKDFMLIIVVVLVAAVFSFVVSGFFISTPEDRSQSVEIAEPINPEFQRPPAAYFNQEAINPTQTIEIGEDSNEQPFDTE